MKNGDLVVVVYNGGLYKKARLIDIGENVYTFDSSDVNARIQRDVWYVSHSDVIGVVIIPERDNR